MSDQLGLGLVISRDLANLMGGDCHATSEYGKGSSFTFTFLAERDSKARTSYEVFRSPRYVSKLVCPGASLISAGVVSFSVHLDHRGQCCRLSKCPLETTTFQLMFQLGCVQLSTCTIRGYPRGQPGKGLPRGLELRANIPFCLCRRWYDRSKLIEDDAGTTASRQIRVHV